MSVIFDKRCGKVTLSPYWSKHHARKMYPGAEVQYSILNLALDRGKPTVSLLGRFTTGEKSPINPLNGRLCRPQKRSGHYGQKNKLCPCQESNPYSLVMLLESSHYTDRVVQALCLIIMN
jgi:hypothetical protein